LQIERQKIIYALLPELRFSLQKNIVPIKMIWRAHNLRLKTNFIQTIATTTKMINVEASWYEMQYGSSSYPYSTSSSHIACSDCKHSAFSIEISPLFFMLPVGHLSLASPRAHFSQPAAVDYDMRMCSASIAAELRRDEGCI
jgi:hypothetical protein